MRLFWFHSKVFLVGIILMLMIPGCVTTKFRSNETQVIHALALQPLFSACIPGDGSAQFSLVGAGKTVSGVELVWNFIKVDYWDVQFNSIIGETQLEMSRRKSLYETKGIAEIKLSHDSAGFLIVDERPIPLKEEEISCFLAGRWPVTWLTFLREASSGVSGKYLYRGDDGMRGIVLTASVSPDARSLGSCAVIQWGGVLGVFRHKSQICLTRTSGGNYSAELLGPSDFQVKWWVENESK
ncbi:MAG: hypothetical protein NTV34_13125 [Proteobacteria bacterium]|nr:hypothetical protein [Pseudomonadota bacterium]